MKCIRCDDRHGVTYPIYRCCDHCFIFRGECVAGGKHCTPCPEEGCVTGKEVQQ